MLRFFELSKRQKLLATVILIFSICVFIIATILLVHFLRKYSNHSVIEPCKNFEEYVCHKKKPNDIFSFPENWSDDVIYEMCESHLLLCIDFILTY
ncbi:unnamed protein product [Schistosoma turkestanicum]|nr:unnamed protein product [Schistosoma turkestanicum]